MERREMEGDNTITVIQNFTKARITTCHLSRRDNHCLVAQNSCDHTLNAFDVFLKSPYNLVKDYLSMDIVKFCINSVQQRSLPKPLTPELVWGRAVTML